MPDSTTDIFKGDPGRLVKLLELEADSGRDWQPDELGPILRHQLASPVKADIQDAQSEADGIRTFEELFRHPQPPVELLKLTKEFAKAHRRAPDSPLPREVASVLYYACIVAAQANAGEWITGLGRSEVGEGVRWVLGQEWVSEDLKSWFRTNWEKVMGVDRG